MIKLMATNIARNFFNNHVFDDETDIDVYSYGLEIMLASTMNVLAIFGLSIIFHQFIPTVAFMLVFMAMRTFAGGYHAKTHLTCFLIFLFFYGVMLLLAAALPAEFINPLFITMTMVSSIIIVAWAPIIDQGTPLKKSRIRKNRKIAMVLLSLVVLFIVVLYFVDNTKTILLCASFGLFAASISLAAAKILNKRRVI